MEYEMEDFLYGMERNGRFLSMEWNISKGMEFHSIP